MLIGVVSSFVLAISTAWSVGGAHDFGTIMETGLYCLPAKRVLAGLALLLGLPLYRTRGTDELAVRARPSAPARRGTY